MTAVWVYFARLLKVLVDCITTAVGQKVRFEMILTVSTGLILLFIKSYRIYGLYVTIIYLALAFLRFQTIGLATLISLSLTYMPVPKC